MWLVKTTSAYIHRTVSDIPFSFISCYLQVKHVNIQPNFTTLLKACHFQYNLHLYQKTFPTFEKNTCSCPINAALILLQPLMHDILHCLVICIVVSLQLVSQMAKQTKIWWCEVRILRWMQQHCPSKLCDGTNGANTCGTNSIKATIQTS